MIEGIERHSSFSEFSSFSEQHEAIKSLYSILTNTEVMDEAGVQTKNALTELIEDIVSKIENPSAIEDKRIKALVEKIYVQSGLGKRSELLDKKSLEFSKLTAERERLVDEIKNLSESDTVVLRQMLSKLDSQILAVSRKLDAMEEKLDSVLEDAKETVRTELLSFMSKDKSRTVSGLIQTASKNSVLSELNRRIEILTELLEIDGRKGRKELTKEDVDFIKRNSSVVQMETEGFSYGKWMNVDAISSSINQLRRVVGAINNSGFFEHATKVIYDEFNISMLELDTDKVTEIVSHERTSFADGSHLKVDPHVPSPYILIQLARISEKISFTEGSVIPVKGFGGIDTPFILSKYKSYLGNQLSDLLTVEEMIEKLEFLGKMVNSSFLEISNLMKNDQKFKVDWFNLFRKKKQEVFGVSLRETKGQMISSTYKANKTSTNDHIQMRISKMIASQIVKIRDNSELKKTLVGNGLNDPESEIFKTLDNLKKFSKDSALYALTLGRLWRILGVSIEGGNVFYSQVNMDEKKTNFSNGEWDTEYGYRPNGIITVAAYNIHKNRIGNLQPQELLEAFINDINSQKSAYEISLDQLNVQDENSSLKRVSKLLAIFSIESVENTMINFSGEKEFGISQYNHLTEESLKNEKSGMPRRFGKVHSIGGMRNSSTGKGSKYLGLSKKDWRYLTMINFMNGFKNGKAVVPIVIPSDSTSIFNSEAEIYVGKNENRIGIEGHYFQDSFSYTVDWSDENNAKDVAEFINHESNPMFRAVFNSIREEMKRVWDNNRIFFDTSKWNTEVTLDEKGQHFFNKNLDTTKLVQFAHYLIASDGEVLIMESKSKNRRVIIKNKKFVYQSKVNGNFMDENYDTGADVSTLEDVFPVGNAFKFLHLKVDGRTVSDIKSLHSRGIFMKDAFFDVYNEVGNSNVTEEELRQMPQSMSYQRIEKLIADFIKKDVESMSKIFLADFKKQKTKTEAGKLYRTFLDNVVKTNINGDNGNFLERNITPEEFIYSFVINSHLAYSTQFRELNGDIYLYKSMLETNKRAKQMVSPALRHLWDRPNFRVIQTNDVEVEGNAEVNNGQVFVSVKFAKDYFRSRNQLTESLEKALDAADNGTLFNSENKSLQKEFFPVLKLFYFDRQQISYDTADGDQVVFDSANQIKAGFFILSKAITSSLPELEKLRKFMEENEVDMAVPPSAFKVGMTSVMNIFNSDETVDETKFDKSMVRELPIEKLGTQQDFPDHFKDDDASALTQLRKLIFSNMNLEAEYEVGGSTMKGSDLMKLYEKTMFNIAEKISTEIELKQSGLELYQTVIDQIRNSGRIPSNSIELVEKMFLDVPGLAYQFESMLASMWNSVQKESTPGGSAVNVSALGFKKPEGYVWDKNVGGIEWSSKKAPGRLQFSKLENGEVTEVEILVARPQGILNRFSIDELSDEVLSGICARIPTEAKYSTIRYKIVGFLPDVYRGVVVGPHEIQGVSGLDFDGDKYFFMYYNLMKDNGMDLRTMLFSDEEMTEEEMSESMKDKVKLLRMTEEEDFRYAQLLEKDVLEEKEKKELSLLERKFFMAEQNKIVDIFSSILKHKDSHKEMTDPASFKEITRIKDIISALYKIDEKDIVPTSVMGQFLFREAAVNGVTLKGIGAKSLAALHIFQKIRATAFKEVPVYYDISEKENLLKTFGKAVEIVLNGKGEETGVIVKHKHLGWNEGLNGEILFGSAEGMDKGLTITQVLAKLPANFFDIIKQPIPLGWNKKSINTIVAMLMMGIDLETVSFFVAQPSIREIFEGKIDSEGMVSEENVSDNRMFTNTRTKWIRKAVVGMGEITYAETEHFSRWPSKSMSVEELSQRLSNSSSSIKSSLISGLQKIGAIRGETVVGFDEFLLGDRAEINHLDKRSMFSALKAHAASVVGDKDGQRSMTKTDMAFQLEMLNIFKNINGIAFRVQEATQVVDADTRSSGPEVMNTLKFKSKMEKVSQAKDCIRTIDGTPVAEAIYGPDSKYDVLKTFFTKALNKSLGIIAPHFMKYSPAFLGVLQRLDAFNRDVDYISSITSTLERKIMFNYYRKNLEDQMLKAGKKGIDAQIQREKIFLIGMKLFNVYSNGRVIRIDMVEPKTIADKDAVKRTDSGQRLKATFPELWDAVVNLRTLLNSKAKSNEQVFSFDVGQKRNSRIHNLKVMLRNIAPNEEELKAGFKSIGSLVELIDILRLSGEFNEDSIVHKLVPMTQPGETQDNSFMSLFQFKDPRDRIFIQTIMDELESMLEGNNGGTEVERGISEVKKQFGVLLIKHTILSNQMDFSNNSVIKVIPPRFFLENLGFEGQSFTSFTDAMKIELNDPTYFLREGNGGINILDEIHGNNAYNSDVVPRLNEGVVNDKGWMSEVDGVRVLEMDSWETYSGSPYLMIPSVVTNEQLSKTSVRFLRVMSNDNGKLFKKIGDRKDGKKKINVYIEVPILSESNGKFFEFGLPSLQTVSRSLFRKTKDKDGNDIEMFESTNDRAIRIAEKLGVRLMMTGNAMTDMLSEVVSSNQDGSDLDGIIFRYDEIIDLETMVEEIEKFKVSFSSELLDKALVLVKDKMKTEKSRNINNSKLSMTLKEQSDDNGVMDDYVFIGRGAQNMSRNRHYGNPEMFGADDHLNLNRSVDLFEAWLMSELDPDGYTHKVFIGQDGEEMTTKETEPERRSWIVSKILSGNLDDKTLVCFGAHGKGTSYRCHGEVLLDAIKRFGPKSDPDGEKATKKFGFTLDAVTESKQEQTRKDMRKSSISNKFIYAEKGIYNEKRSSTLSYANSAKTRGIPVNDTSYESDDIVFVSNSGGEGEFGASQLKFENTKANMEKAIEAGASFAMDSTEYSSKNNFINGSHSEHAIIKWLLGQGYEEKPNGDTSVYVKTWKTEKKA